MSPSPFSLAARPNVRAIKRPIILERSAGVNQASASAVVDREALADRKEDRQVGACPVRGGEVVAGQDQVDLPVWYRS